MNDLKEHIKNTIITLIILLLCFIFSLLLQHVFKNNELVSAIFVLGVFLISVATSEYIYGIVSSLLSVLTVNFAFVSPAFAFNFSIPENIISAVILLVVTMVTCGLTAEVKHHEAIKVERDKERMRANLLRAVSHDLRTPLTTIYSTSSALLEKYDEFSGEQCRNMIKGISEDSQWLYRMVENLLSITRLDSGNVKILKTETMLDELVDSVLVKFAKRYPNQTVDVDIPDEFILIPMDALLIEQVMLNILENAVQHAEGMTKLSLKVFTKSGKVIFEIKDNGKGIAGHKIKEIFKGVYNDALDDKRTNAGIGLSVCASIIKAHGGDIKAENLKGGGALLRFTLNMEEKENA